MPLKKGKSRETINKNTEKLIHEGKPVKQAYAIAMANAGKSRGKESETKKEEMKEKPKAKPKKKK